MKRILALSILVACGGDAPPPRAPTYVASSMAPLPALPQGWAWPFDPQAAARGLLPPNTVFRPVNVAALQARRASTPQTPCSIVEVAPNVWITPLCGHLRIGRTLKSRMGINAVPPGAPATMPAPESYDLRPVGLDGPIKHQQSAPVCWSFAFSNVMENALRRAGRAELIAPLSLIVHDDWRVVTQNGRGHVTTLEPTWPYDPHKACKLDHNSNEESCESAYGIKSNSYREDPELAGEAQRMESAGAYSIAAIKSLADSPGDPDEVARTIAGGQAVYAELQFNRTAWSMPSSGRTNTLPDWEPDGEGGHAVTIVAYTTKDGRRWFLLHNSWGPSWGEDGYAWISAEMVRARLVDAWTVTLADAQGRVLGSGATPPPPPPPPPIPPPQPNTGGRTTPCHLSGIINGEPPHQPRDIPLGESICTESNSGGTSPGPWLQYCGRLSGAAKCSSEYFGHRECASAVINGKSIAACCPPGVTNPLDPRCETADRLHSTTPGSTR